VEEIDKNRNAAIIINKVQLLLAAKRASHTTVRTVPYTAVHKAH
jgi:hypothetical protein